MDKPTWYDTVCKTSLFVKHVRTSTSDCLGTRSIRFIKLTRINVKDGDIALKGEEEEYLSIHIFDAVDYDRWITGRGTLITVYDPNAAKKTKPYWEYENTTENASSFVPRQFKVRVIEGWVKMTKSAPN